MSGCRRQEKSRQNNASTCIIHCSGLKPGAMNDGIPNYCFQYGRITISQIGMDKMVRGDLPTARQARTMGFVTERYLEAA